MLMVGMWELELGEKASVGLGWHSDTDNSQSHSAGPAHH